MYEKYFYLKEKPFNVTPDPRFLYLSAKHREAIDLLSFGITERKGFIVLTGEVGTGKTTLLRALLERLPEKVETALILNPLLSDTELLKTIIRDFGIDAGPDPSRADIDRLNEFLIKVNSDGGNAVVIIDEAQHLSPTALEMLRLLSNLETDREKLLQIVMAGQPELRDMLNMPELRQLNQRIIVRYHLMPLDRDETSAYIQSRLFVAGGSGTVGFTEEAITKVFEKTNGIPRMINITCDRALLHAFISEKKVVDLGSAVKASSELESEGYLSREQTEVNTQGYACYVPRLAAYAVAAACLAWVLLVL